MPRNGSPGSTSTRTGIVAGAGLSISRSRSRHSASAPTASSAASARSLRLRRIDHSAQCLRVGLAGQRPAFEHRYRLHTPAYIGHEGLALPPITCPALDNISTSSSGASRIALCARTCSSRLRCLSPASSGFMPSLTLEIATRKPCIAGETGAGEGATGHSWRARMRVGVSSPTGDRLVAARAPESESASRYSGPGRPRARRPSRHGTLRTAPRPAARPPRPWRWRCPARALAGRSGTPAAPQRSCSDPNRVVGHARAATAPPRDRPGAADPPDIPPEGTSGSLGFSPAEAAEYQCAVGAAEAEGVRDRDVDHHRPRVIGHVVEVTVRIGCFVVGGRWCDLIADRQHAEDRLYHARGAKQMPGHGLGGAHGEARSMLAEGPLDGDGLGPITERSRGGMRVQILHIARIELRIAQGVDHGEASPGAVLGRSRDVMRIGAHAEAGQFGIDACATRAGVLELLEHHRTTAIAQYKAVAIAVPRATRALR